MTRMRAAWTLYRETLDHRESHESEMGRVESRPEGWEAWVYIPEKLRVGHATKHKIGECYPTAASAKAAVARAWRKYAPLNSGALK